MDAARRGVVAIVSACSVWGLSPLYYKHLAFVPPAEVLAHRTIWTLVFFGVLLAGQGRLARVWHSLRGRDRWPIALAAAIISSNWFLFIWAIQAGHGVEASLGYYIFPLVAVAIGVVALRERLSLGQGLAVGLASAAVVVLTFGLGVAPWVALALAGTFAVYGVLKKRISSSAVVSVTAEVLVLAPLALMWLLGAHFGGWTEGGRAGGFFGRDLETSALLMFSGVITGGPLILFSYGAQRVRLSTLGLTQYLNPTLQFLVAVLVFAEPFTLWHKLAFGMIWAALAIYTVESWRQDRSDRSAAVRLGTSGTAVK
jgi:chloramphenicol-sensitive protein RarD